MRKLYAIVCLALLSNAYKAQETLPYYQQYLLDGEFLFNPAQYGKTDYVQLNLNYQQQFTKFSESPNVQSVGINANIFDRVGAGISVFRDSNGPISAGGITAGASYFIPLSSEGDRKDQFSFGTSVSFYNMNFDYSKINTEDASDPLLQGSESNIFMAYANFGVAATYRNIFAGVSVNDIALTNDESIINGREPSPIKFFLNLGYDWHFADNMYVTPSALINLNTNSTRTIDYNLMATFFNDINSFSFGVNYRSVQNRFDSQQLQIAPVVKVRFNKFMVGATYNIGLSDIQEYGGNSFMIGLGYNFDNFINHRGYRY
ncbi:MULTISPECIES: PorP/SprF family type IX secretion system membrane protein [Chryseobacterium]|uniref:Type IX secretion system PorP/SprF family membrane protein n=1 Tax=Chryseobacterium camelliae TaxID=1265445 RepID=A0ABU0TCU0_9FLAO|nr:MULTISPECIES: PorP/SprF family type IX secretion system membrane protein [Chryseobacterium]MDT3407314.1 type IX secretion system PorP/SprF family membrane protein [Pseudacidovorax intermedius]MDQ1094897.1 type IX secretion system PorP/SprF family membrane protein [Chryseobacterium camelliae]MDQ1098836.1 type IX secretion system PorP/SprF family membrane protein [Chryseobacterium sp. SORGH_AS_1048]MDR6086186.1 type IX secretion system PorP/SprF family membrane protein [Chryseobacterium sp. SO